jgi:predicted transglutaminase-like cysteine proteinase
VKYFLVSCGLALSSCTEASVIETVNTDVNRIHPYKHYAKAGLRELKPGEPGNCAAIAFTKKAELARHGISSSVLTCRLTSGEGHAFPITEEGGLDNRFDWPVPYDVVGCR